MEFVNKYVAPWVLPGQAFPIHCVWVPEKGLKKIELSIPCNYVLEDTLNFTEYVYDRSTNAVTILVENLKSDNYFGIVISYPSIIDEIEKRDEVKVRFLSEENNALDELSFHTRIVRPKLEFLDCSKEIIVSDGTNPKDLINLEILHSGFGTANLDISVNHSGTKISKTDSIYIDVVRRILEEIASMLEGNEDVSEPEEFDVDEDILRKTASTLLNEVNQRNLLFDLTSDELREIMQLLKNKQKKEIVYKVVLSNLRSLLMAALLYYSDRHPEEDIKLTYGNIAADLRSIMDELSIRIVYHDSLWNVYPPIELKIKVLDRRSQKNKLSKFETPINIRWKRVVLDLGDGKKE